MAEVIGYSHNNAIEEVPFDCETKLVLNSILWCIDVDTGLPGDKLFPNLEVEAITSPTNIGLVLMVMVAARDLGMVSDTDAKTMVAKMGKTLVHENMSYSHHLPLNWINVKTGFPLKEWPGTNKLADLFFSSIDAAWLYAGIYAVTQAFPHIQEFHHLLGYFDLGKFYRESTGLCAGYLNLDGSMSSHDYGAITETRLISYMGVALGQIPPEHLLFLWRRSRELQQERYPEWNLVNPRTVPTWGGSLFEALAVSLIFNESRMAPHIFPESFTNHVKAHQNGACEKTKVWGYSPSQTPRPLPGPETYDEYGWAPLGLFRKGYHFGNINNGLTEPNVSLYSVDLALIADVATAMEGWERIGRNFRHLFGRFGGPDAINTVTGEGSQTLLVLDQCMRYLARAQTMSPECVRKYFRPLEDRLMPYLASWHFPSS